MYIVTSVRRETCRNILRIPQSSKHTKLNKTIIYIMSSSTEIFIDVLAQVTKIKLIKCIAKDIEIAY